jgi:hypothetical protein
MRPTLLLLSSLAFPATISAQGTRIAPRASVVFTTAAPVPTEGELSNGILGDGSKDYRYTGFWVGAGAGLVFTYYMYEFCVESEGGCSANAGQLLLGTLILAGTTSLLGALVGAQFDR